MPPAVPITPAELRGVRRVAHHDGGRTVAVARAASSPLEVEVGEPILEQHLLFVGPDGTVYRLGSEFELAARQRDVYRTNLLPLGDAELDPLPDPEPSDRFDALSDAVVRLELRALAEGQEPEGAGARLALRGEGFLPTGAEGRREMRALLDELDRREAAARARAAIVQPEIPTPEGAT